MEKIRIVFFVLVVTFVVLTLAVLLLPRVQNPSARVTAATCQTSTEAELEVEHVDLQTQHQRILAEGMRNELVNTASAISSEQAGEVAVAFIGHGMVVNTALLDIDGVSTFEIDIRYGDGRYLVFVNADNGNVVRMSRHDAGDGLEIPLTCVVPDYSEYQCVQAISDTARTPIDAVSPTTDGDISYSFGAELSQSPDSNESPSSIGGASLSPESWSSPSPEGWSSPSPGNSRWTGTCGSEWTWERSN